MASAHRVHLPRHIVAGCLLLAMALSGCAQAPVDKTPPPAPPAPTPVGANAAAASPPAREPANTLDAIRRAGVLRIGVISIPPWALPSPTGELMGFEIDAGRQLAADLGVRPEFVRTSLASYAGDLAAGFFDVAAAGIWPDPTSALLVNFSQPYALNTIDFIVNTKRSRAKDSGAYNRPGVIIGVRDGSQSKAVADRQFPLAQVRTYDEDAPMFTALVEGRLTAIVAASPVGGLLTAAYPKLLAKPLAKPLASRREAFAVMRGDADLVSYLDAWIVHKQDSGWLSERRNYWFRSLKWASQL